MVKSVANLVEPDVARISPVKQHPEIKDLNVPFKGDDHFEGFGIGIKKENQSLFNKYNMIIQGT